MTIEHLGGYAGRGAAAKRVQHHIAFLAGRPDDLLQQGQRLLRRVARALLRGRLDDGDLPHIRDRLAFGHDVRQLLEAALAVAPASWHPDDFLAHLVQVDLLLARKPKEERVEDRLDGTYIIIDVASGNVSDGYRATVCEVDTGEELRLEIPGGTLTEDQVEQLQEGEWGKKPLQMQINIRRVGRRIKKATLIRAGLSVEQ